MNQVKEVKSTVRRNLNVETASNVLGSAIADMSEVVDALEEHLKPLLGDERPCCASEDRCRGESEVAERILSSADVIRGRAERIRQLIERL